MSSILLLLTSFAHAADTSRVEPLGFGVEGKYFLFAERGIDDQSRAFAQVFLVDVDKNSYAAPPARIHGKSKLSSDFFKKEAALSRYMSQAFTKAETQFASLGVKSFHLRRPVMLKRGPRMTQGGPGHVMEQHKFVARIKKEGKNRRKKVKHKLKMILTNTKPDAPNKDCRAYALKLTVSSDAGSVDLQADKAPAKWRSCVHTYRVHSVHQGPNRRIAILLEVELVEDTKIQHMVVTGVLP